MAGDSFSEWSAEEQRALRELVSEYRKHGDVGEDSRGSASRRDVLKSLGIMGAGALVGGGASASMTQTASAASNQVGQIGANGSPVDVIAEDVDAVSVNAEQLLGTYPGKVRAFSDGEVVASIDPANKSTPVQDAVDTIGAGSGRGTIILPPGTTTENGAPDISGHNIGITGYGWQISTLDVSPGSTEAGITMDELSGFSRFIGFTLSGPSATATGPGILSTSPGNAAAGNVVIDQVRVTNFGDSGLRTRGLCTDWDVRTIRCDNIDAGGNGVLDIEAGTSFRVGVARLVATDAVSGSASRGCRVINGNVEIGTLTIGGSLLDAARFDGHDSVSVDAIHYEPNSTGGARNGLVLVDGGGPADVGRVVVSAAGVDPSFDHIYQLGGANGAGGVTMGPYRLLSGATGPAVSTVDVVTDTTDACFFKGPSGQVTNATGTALSHPVACLEDFVQVT